MRLRARSAIPAWRSFGCRHGLGNPGIGAQQHAKAHIPGALHAGMKG
jgi:hypothetical protein